jgi:acetone carboxylase gamma subunit
VERDIEEGHLLPRFAESAYGIPDREAFRRRRLGRARPVRSWWRAARERVLAQEAVEPVRVMYAEAMRLSPRFAAEYRGFWDLPEDFQWQAVTPTVKQAKAEPGKLTPEEVADEFLRNSEVTGGPPPGPRGHTLEAETLASLLDEKLARRTVKDIQSGYKDSDRFEKWVAVLQQRARYDDPIVLPLGEGLNVVSPIQAGRGGRASAASDGTQARGAGQLVIRCDCGHDFCRPDRNWKMEAVVFVRDSDELMQEIYPRMGHADTDWMELREFYCPSCARQLEVEAVPPGYPVVHDFLPDVEGFYRGWLGRELPTG